MNTSSRPSQIQASRPVNAANHDAMTLARSLKQMLDQEFEALKARDIVRFETLQTEKTNLLALISAAAGPDASRLPAGATREDFKDLVARCRDALRRNECLVSHQLASIRGALNTLTAGSQGPGV